MKSIYGKCQNVIVFFSFVFIYLVCSSVFKITRWVNNISNHHHFFLSSVIFNSLFCYTIERQKQCKSNERKRRLVFTIVSLFFLLALLLRFNEKVWRWWWWFKEKRNASWYLLDIVCLLSSRQRTREFDTWLYIYIHEKKRE